MFRGHYDHNVDEKGRLSIPSKFREIMISNFDSRLIVTSFDECLWVYPFAEWQAVEAKVSELPQFKEEVIAFKRVFISSATECPIDKAGRIQIPPVLRDYAGIEREVVIVGMIRRIEIWSKGRWEKIFQKAQNDLGGLGGKLADLGL